MSCFLDLLVKKKQNFIYMPGLRFIYYSKFSCIWDDVFNFTSFTCMHVQFPTFFIVYVCGPLGHELLSMRATTSLSLPENGSFIPAR